MNINQQNGLIQNISLITLLSETENIRKCSKQSDAQVESVSMILNLSNSCLELSPNLRKRKRKHEESVEESKKAKSKDKSNSSEKSILTIKSSKTLNTGPKPRGRGKDCVPFWTEFTKKLSDKLWFCTKKDSLDLPVDSWNTSLKKLASNSWFTVQAKTSRTLVTSPKICSPSLPSLSQAIMEKEALNIAECENKDKMSLKKMKVEKSEDLVIPMQLEAEEEKTFKKKNKKKKKKKMKEWEKEEEEEDSSLRVKKIRVYFSREQEKTLNVWYGAVRWVYNQSVNVVKKKGVSKKELKISS